MTRRADPPWRRLAEAASRGPDPGAATAVSVGAPARPAGHRPRPGKRDGARDRAPAVQAREPARPVAHRERRWDLRLIAPAAVIWAGTATAVTVPGAAGWGLVGAAAAGIALLVVALLASGPRSRPGTRRRASLLAGAALLLLAGAALGTGRTAHDTQRAGPIGAAIVAGRAVTADLVVSEEPHPLRPDAGSPRDAQLLVRGTITAATAAGARFSASTPVLVVGDDRWRSVRPGQTVRVAGTLAATAPGAREAAFLRASAPPRVLVEPGPGEDLAATIRWQLRERSAARSPDAGQLVPGLVLGDRTPLGDELRTAMRTASLTHLTAVSGTNCTIVLGCVLGLGVLLRLPRWSLVPGALAALAAFVLVVGPDPSVLRAAAMGAVGVVAVISGRGRAPVAMLCTAVGVLLLVDPYLATALGFALSVVATAALVGLCGPIGDAVTALLPAAPAARVPVPVIRLIAAPLAAQVACAPLLLLVQPGVSTWGVVANALVAPLVPVVTVAGSTAVLLGSAWAPLAVLPLQVAASGADAIAAVARTAAAAPAATLPWPEGPAGAALLTVASALAIVVLLGAARHRSRGPRTTGRAAGSPRSVRPAPALRPPPSRMPRMRLPPAGPGRVGARMLVRAAVVTSGLGLVAAGTAAFTVAVPAAGEWQLAVCDVGQGDGLVLRAGEGTAMLVDSGPPGPAMARCLDRLGVRRLAAVVLTHQHDDHYGGLAEAVRGRVPQRVLVSAADATLAPPVAALLGRIATPVDRLQAPAHGSVGAVTWSVLWPLSPRPIGDENDNSVVLRVDIAAAAGPPLRVLLTGDLEEDAAAALLRLPGTSAALRGVDVIKLAHHGARNGGTALLDAVRAPLALVSVGRDNEYGHPAATVLDHAREVGATVWRTDQRGGATVRRTSDRVVATALPP